MPDEDKNLHDSLAFDCGIWWRQVKTIFSQDSLSQFTWRSLRLPGCNVRRKINVFYFHGSLQIPVCECI